MSAINTLQFQPLLLHTIIMTKEKEAIIYSLIIYKSAKNGNVHGTN